MFSTIKIDERTEKNRGNLHNWLLIYASCYALFHILPPFLSFQIKNRFIVGDLFDILTPFIMVFLIYKIYRILGSIKQERTILRTSSTEKILLIFGVVLFIEGHGMHLSANAIARHLPAIRNQPLFDLTYFFDEILGHILWDGGILLISFGFILMEFNLDKTKIPKFNQTLIILGGLIYGFTYYANAVEGQTVFFTLPMSILIPIIIYIVAKVRKVQILKNPILFFFTVSYSVSFLFFFIWFVWQSGLPQFSELGWI